MNNLTKMMAILAFLSGCAAEPYYDVVKHYDDGKTGYYREKRNLDADVAEEGREWDVTEWDVNWRGNEPGECWIRREGPYGLFDTVQYHSKKDVNCAVWDATEGPERKARFYIF